MFAIIKTGGKQYKVAKNDVLMIEKLTGTSGDFVEFTDVLMMGQGDSIKIGSPLVPNVKVLGAVLDQIRDDKIIIFKKTRRHNYRRKNGHRQYLTVIRITDILSEGATPKVKATPEKAVLSEGATPKVKATPEKAVLSKGAASKVKATPGKAVLTEGFAHKVKVTTKKSEKKVRASAKKVTVSTEEKAVVHVKKKAAKTKKQTENLGD